MTTEIYIYAAIIILSLIVEASTSTLVAIWFIPGAIAGIILSLLNVGTTVQTVAFFAVSLVLMLLFYKKLRDIIEVKTEKTGIDALIGAEAVAEDDISYLKPGRIKVNGMSWSAYINKGDRDIKKGDCVTVLSVDGVKLYCKKLQDEAALQASQENNI